MHNEQKTMGKENQIQVRIYILEGLDPRFVEASGSYFFMDPMFFIRHERNTVWDMGDVQEGFTKLAAVILCEPPVHEVYRGHSLFPQEMKSEIFQGGYVDFIDFDILTRDGLNGAFDGPPRTCMLDDLCFYLEHHSPLLFEMEGATPPLITSVFLKKITASHYVKLIDYFEIIVQRLRKTEWQLSRQTDWQAYKSWPEK
ncbi:predicted protein [Sclerotinia sclerotiorum 1980 UF-70]|uniref:Uncharacterized protein n=2 Tax=Sclerotinia sclerotiorum (strain ATCC 18683 / 1980 / Ss-1) TaxID=665079 RepID=A7ET76_SCLS1|nr:predicted protein [Sclerotinia sclerotiorum 1980 UF-70]APA13031.1 hypothetical protein sscle_10g078010 [Sclerotinia sclerotiorum 1980 UF-70]EDN92668.1 predicted protein [Sclerotinia sclerotiorum 1980 UF-70]